MLRACASVPAITTITTCKNAQASVDQMNAVFANLGSPSQYSAQVQAITQNLAAQMPILASIGVGIGMCGTVFQIGIQADMLTNQMLTDNGQSPVPGPTCLDATAVPLPTGGQITAGVFLLAALALFLVLKK